MRRSILLTVTPLLAFPACAKDDAADRSVEAVAPSGDTSQQQNAPVAPNVASSTPSFGSGGQGAAEPSSAVPAPTTSAPPESTSPGGAWGSNPASGAGASSEANGGSGGGTPAQTGGTGPAPNTDAGSPVESAGSGGESPSGSAGSPGSGGTNTSPNPPLEGDRCDVAVYDPDAPPQRRNLSGSLGVHDPVVMEQDGTFYLFATGYDLAAKTSTDLSNWSASPEVFQEVSRPSWIAERVPGVSNLWAPDISYFGGLYHLYYSASTFGENTSCIGHLTRESLSSGGWQAEDEPTVCTTGTEDYNAIDPNVVLDTDGTPWLSFGSFWDGIRIFELDQEGRRVGDELHAIASRGGEGIEAPFIVRRCGYYYLFTSWDSCCQGTSSTYNIRVGRSAEVLGPYVDQEERELLDGGGTLLVEGDDEFHGPGHNAIIFSGDKAYNVYHAYPGDNGQLRISEIAWNDEGWPLSAGP